MQTTQNQITPENPNSIGGQASMSLKVDSVGDSRMESILVKIAQYKETIKFDKRLESELRYYIEPCTKLHSSSSTFDSDEQCDLALDITKNLLAEDSKAKTMLLTGSAGSGKSLFCKYLQRLIILNSDVLEQWLPIVVQVPDLKAPLTSAVSETLIKDLVLTEEETELLKAAQKDLGLRLLLIFDSAEGIIQSLKAETKKCPSDNFYMRNRFAVDWAEAKVIITCREESLAEINQREYLFAPLDSKTEETIKGFFLERCLQPLSDNEIRSFLKIYLALNSNMNGEKRRHSSLFGEPSALKYEIMIDEIGIRELIRSPYLLSRATGILEELFTKALQKNPSFDWSKDASKKRSLQLKSDKRSQMPKGPIQESAQQQSGFSLKSLFQSFVSTFQKTAAQKLSPKEEKEKMAFLKQFDSKALTGFKQLAPYNLLTLYQDFVELSMKSAIQNCFPNNKGNQENLMFKLQQRALLYARRTMMRDSFIDNEDKSFDEEDLDANKLDELLISSGLMQITPNSAHCLQFTHRTLQEFFISQIMEDEIIRINNMQDRLDIQSAFLFNRNLLHRDESLVLSFLIDLVKCDRISAQTLMNCVYNSELYTQNPLNNQFEEEEKKEIAPFNSEGKQELLALNGSNMLYAASNAITILNALKYDFSGMDLSKIWIPHANLSHGIFEGANFFNANLQGVNFTGAWLKDANFSRSNMKEVQFGAMASLELSVVVSSVICYGKNILAAAGKEIFLFERESKSSGFKKVRKFSKDDDSEKMVTISINDNRDRIVSGDKSQTVRVWESSSERCLSSKRLKVETINKGDYLRYIRGNLRFTPNSSDLVSVYGLLLDKFIGPTVMGQIRANLHTLRVDKWNFTSNENVCLDEENFEKTRSHGCNIDSDIDCKSQLIATVISSGLYYPVLQYKQAGKLSFRSGTTGKVRASMKAGNILEVASVKFNTEGKTLALIANIGETSIIDAIRGHLVKFSRSHSRKQEKESYKSCVFTPDSRGVMLRSSDGVEILDIANGNYVRVLEKKDLSALEFSQDGKMLALICDSLICVGEFSNFCNRWRTKERESQTVGANKKGLSIDGIKNEMTEGFSGLERDLVERSTSFDR